MKDMKTRAYNFGAGPATLPESILAEAQAELLNWQDLGLSILEIGHRTPEFISLLEQAEADLRLLLAIPKHYHVLFLSGAARTQFAMIPMNFLAKGERAGYLVSGIWSELAFKEAQKLADVYCLASSKDQEYKTVPNAVDYPVDANTRYIYYTPNETINGVRYPQVPQVSVPLIADMTSCLLSEPINVTDFGLIFAGAQKNISIAGLTVVIVRHDLLNLISHASIPTMLDYRTHAQYKSLYATPPVFNCYIAAKMFAWVKKQGGVSTLYQQNCQKAAKLYTYIDHSEFYNCPVAKEARSLMNVCFSLPTQELEEKFIMRAAEQGLLALRGHRAVGGLRASLYNAMPMDGVEALIGFMQDFAEEYHS